MVSTRLSTGPEPQSAHGMIGSDEPASEARRGPGLQAGAVQDPDGAAGEILKSDRGSCVAESRYRGAAL